MAPKWPISAGLAGSPLFSYPAPRSRIRGLRGQVTIHRFPRGLGQTQTGQEIASYTSTAGAVGGAGVAIGASSGLIAASSAAIAVPVIGAAVALVALIAHFVGGGCGNACVDSAKAEQIYEVAADDILAVAKLGMIGQADAIAAMQALLQGGQQHMAQLQ
jgi:hypothetical protein